MQPANMCIMRFKQSKVIHGYQLIHSCILNNPMKDHQLNQLSKNQRKLLQFGVILILIIFLVYYLFFRKEGNINSVRNNTVTLQDSKLQVFDDTYTLKPYPDRMLMHYPYFLVIQADKPLTTIYNLETKQKEKEVKDILLDYYKGNSIY